MTPRRPRHEAREYQGELALRRLTRVSTEHGLEQEFNSLDNRREASEAYIKSQAHEGWRLMRDRYDDGGFSGGSMDRPALAEVSRPFYRAPSEAEPLRRRVVVDRDVVVIDLFGQHLPRAAPGAAQVRAVVGDVRFERFPVHGRPHGRSGKAPPSIISP